MTVTNIHEAKTHFSKLVERAEAGEEIIIGRAGKPVAKLVPIRQTREPLPTPGSMRGKIHFRPGFDEADSAIESLFHESLNEPVD